MFVRCETDITIPVNYSFDQ